MALIISHTEWEANPMRNNSWATLANTFTQEQSMPAAESKANLWASVQALMRKRFGEENLNRLAREVKVGPATASRLKAQETSVGLDLVDKIARSFGVEPWQLLVPGFDPDAPPVAPGASPMAQDIAQMLDAIDDDAHRRRAYALVVQTLQFGAPAAGKEPLRADSPTPETALHK